MNGLCREQLSIATFEEELEHSGLLLLVPGSKEVKTNESKFSAESYLDLGLLDTLSIRVRGRILFWHPQTETWGRQQVNNRNCIFTQGNWPHPREQEHTESNSVLCWMKKCSPKQKVLRTAKKPEPL